MSFSALECSWWPRTVWTLGLTKCWIQPHEDQRIPKDQPLNDYGHCDLLLEIKAENHRKPVHVMYDAHLVASSLLFQLATEAWHGNALKNPSWTSASPKSFRSSEPQKSWAFNSQHNFGDTTNMPKAWTNTAQQSKHTKQTCLANGETELPWLVSISWRYDRYAVNCSDMLPAHRIAVRTPETPELGCLCGCEVPRFSKMVLDVTFRYF